MITKQQWADRLIREKHTIEAYIEDIGNIQDDAIQSVLNELETEIRKEYSMFDDTVRHILQMMDIIKERHTKS